MTGHFRSFRSRLVVVFLGLFVVIQATGYVAVATFMRASARQARRGRAAPSPHRSLARQLDERAGPDADNGRGTAAHGGGRADEVFDRQLRGISNVLPSTLTRFSKAPVPATWLSNEAKGSKRLDTGPL